MKGLKGERKAYGITGPLEELLDDAGLDYKGSRIGRDTKKPWIMYASPRGEPVDLEALDAALLGQGYVHYVGYDEEPEVYPQHGVPGRGQRYTQYRYQKSAPDGLVCEVLYVTTRFYDAGKGKKDYTEFDQIYY